MDIAIKTNKPADLQFCYQDVVKKGWFDSVINVSTQADSNPARRQLSARRPRRWHLTTTARTVQEPSTSIFDHQHK